MAIAIYDNPQSHYTGNANGYYVFDEHNDVYIVPLCPPCALACAKETGHEDIPQSWEPLGHLSGEADTPTHCEECDALIWHPLTPEGYEYVKEHCDAGDGDPLILAAWRKAYLF